HQIVEARVGIEGPAEEVSGFKTAVQDQTQPSCDGNGRDHAANDPTKAVGCNQTRPETARLRINMQRILRRTGNAVAKTPVPTGDGVPGAVNAAGRELDAQGYASDGRRCGDLDRQAAPANRVIGTIGDIKIAHSVYGHTVGIIKSRVAA